MVDNPSELSELFRKLFISYSMAINERRNRTGNLFVKNFKRKIIQKEGYLKSAVVYIHSNPLHHRLIDDFRSYVYSSYKILISEDNTTLKRNDVLEWFGNVKAFIEYHGTMLGRETHEELMIE
jgi:hypothetical protein